MRFLAILRDSFREAVSGWVLQVMLVLAVLIMVLIASISFKPMSLQQELDRHFGTINFLIGLNPESRDVKYRVEKMTLSDPAQPWKSDYNFDVVLAAPNADTLKKAKSSGMPTSPREVKRMVAEKVDFADDLTVTEVEAQPGDEPASEMHYRVATTGSKIPDRLAWFHQPSIFFGLIEVPGSYTLREGVYAAEKRIVNDGGGWITLLVAIVITAGFIPNLLQKGTLDLYISKPIGRSELLLYKYIGGLTFVLLLTSFSVFGVWLVIGMRTGIWSPQFLALIPLLTFYFAVLYAVSTFVAVLTRSTILAILAAVMAWGLFLVVGLANDKVQQAKRAEKEAIEKIRAVQPDADQNEPLPEALTPTRSLLPDWLQLLIQTAHTVFPRTYDLDDRMIQLIAEGVLTDVELKREGRDEPLPPWWGTVGVSLAFIALMLSLSCWRLSTRDG